MLHQLINSVPESRDVFRATFSHCLSTNHRSARWIVGQMAFYLHLGPFSRYVMREIELKIERLDAEAAVARRPANEPAAMLAS